MKPPTSPPAASAAATSSTKPSTLEKVARAICEACGETPDAITHYKGEAPFPRWQEFSDAARAALQSLRQVDDETRREMARSLRLDRSPTEAMGDAWTAAIGHILTEGGEG